MRWKEVIVGLTLMFAVTAGCKQQCFVPECDKDHYASMDLPPNLEDNPQAALVPAGADVPAPADVVHPEREPRYLTLTEALALALEHGEVGIPNPLTLGIVDDSLSSFQGRTVTLSDGVRVLALEPAIVGADIESSLSKFDARWTTSMTWQRIDEPLGGNVLNDFNNGDHAQFQTALLKPLPTGGVAGITFNTQYTLLSSPIAGITNPSYRPSLQFQFEQPLLQGFGVEINQLRANHPGSLLTPFNNSSRVEGILIARLRFDEQRADFQRNLNYLLLNVELAYWNLYGSYWTLYSREQGLRQAYEAWRLNKNRLEAGRISRQDLAQSLEQYESFRGQRIAALGQVLENERQLRGLVGLPVEDNTRLIPVDAPTLAAYEPDWPTALTEALTLRPELVLARQDVKFRQLDLINQKNLLLPDVRATATYNVNSLGTHLDGGPNDPNNAFSNLADNQFHDWTVGLHAEVPLGYRDANAAVRTAHLRLSQSYLSLRDEEKRAQSFLAQQFRLLSQSYEQIKSARAQREAAAVALELRYREYLAGSRTFLDFLLRAQQDWADALRAEYDAVVQYNNALARFEFAKGTIMQHDNIFIAEGGLPHCAQVRAVEHERERKKAIVLRERASPVVTPPCNYEKGSLGLPELPASQPPAIPSLFEGLPPERALPDKPMSAPAKAEPLPGQPVAKDLPPEPEILDKEFAAPLRADFPPAQPDPQRARQDQPSHDLEAPADVQPAGSTDVPGPALEEPSGAAREDLPLLEAPNEAGSAVPENNEENLESLPPLQAHGSPGPASEASPSPGDAQDQTSDRPTLPAEYQDSQQLPEPPSGDIDLESPR